MEEYVGKVKLDLSHYSGEDLYSDGPIEDVCLDIAKNHNEDEYISIIEEKNSWPILYHFSQIRGNIVNWLPITKEDSVLEIGAGCGAITGTLAKMAKKVTCIELSKKRSLINAYRNREKDNIDIIIGNFQDIEKNLTEKFDYITLIGVFEYAASYINGKSPYKEMLQSISKHLNPGGKIIIAIENRLGVKYFAGCREDHLGNYFSGIEGYEANSFVRTFSRSELISKINEAGSFKWEMYYPYPDYKLPTSIYSDKYLPNVGDFSGDSPNFDNTRLNLFDEVKFLNSIAGTDLFKEFSNSFLAVITKKE